MNLTDLNKLINSELTTKIKNTNIENNELSIDVKVSDYHQSAISSGSDAQAAAYIEIQKGGKTSWGVGINPNTTKASFEAIIVGVAKLI